MIPFHVDPAWYENYWWRDSSPRKTGLLAFSRRIVSHPSYPFAAAMTVRQDVRADRQIRHSPSTRRPTQRHAVRTNSVEVLMDRRHIFIAATVGLAAAALLDVRASRQTQDHPPSADRRLEAILTISESNNAGWRMRSVLDNPDCHALIGPHADVALSHSGARHRLLDAPLPPVLSREPSVVPA
jgi:hypothetical protein